MLYGWVIAIASLDPALMYTIALSIAAPCVVAETQLPVVRGPPRQRQALQLFPDLLAFALA